MRYLVVALPREMLPWKGFAHVFAYVNSWVRDALAIRMALIASG